MHPSEVTPRPSVVVDHDVDQSLIRSHPAQPSGHYGHLPLDMTSSGTHLETMNGEPAADPDPHRSLGNHCPSGSLISLTGRGAEHPKRRLERTTSQTPLHDSTDDDDDHQHPPNLRSDTRSSFIGSSGTGTGNSTTAEFSSDEDYGDYDYDSDYDSYDEDGMNIEVGSAQFEGSVVAPDWDSDLYGTGRESIRARLSAHNSERRGSLPMAIPGAPFALTPGDSLFPPAMRSKEDNIGTLRRPSRSLDDEFRKLRLGSGADGTSMGNEGIVHVAPPAPTSVPESDSDWKYLEERNKSKGKFQGTHGAQDHSVSSSVDKLSRAPHISSPRRVQEDFDIQDWNQSLGGGIRGITSLDPRDLRDIIGPNSEYSQIPKSAGSRTSAASSRWLPSWGNNTRRPSTATVSTLAGDSFGRAVGRWGGDNYLAQRRDWSFRRENAGRNGAILAGIGQNYTGRNSITDFATPRGSIMTERSGISLGFGGRDKEADSIRGDEGMKSSSGWKGMQLEDHEIWRNDLVGRFIVSRRATRRELSTSIVIPLNNRIASILRPSHRSIQGPTATACRSALS